MVSNSGANGTSAVHHGSVTHAAAEVKDTAMEQAHRVGAEARAQVRTVVSEVRDKLGEQARTQSDTLVTFLREAVGNLDEMRGDRQDTPAATVVARVADSGRQFADYLDRHGPEGVLQEVEDFARRRPGAFLASALAAGFVIGRLGKGIAGAESHGAESTAGSPPDGDTVVSPDPAAGPQTLLDEFTRLQQHRVVRP
ncbi:hypothetical protein [Actinoplanes subglobosus]|uniref:DUF3618 domain-containing protein n=1 Tax=Actinoplanes subglobosus TaxID=1547892 RepID=A0ABV8IQE4_9ACTN